MSRAQRQSKPHIEHAKDFAHDVEHVGCGMPPAHGIEWIGRGSAHDDAGVAVAVFFPESVNAARVGFCGDDDHGGGVLLFGFGGDRAYFIGGVGDCGSQRVNVGRWNEPMLQDTRAESIFAGIVDIECGERRGGFVWMREPDLRRPAQLVEPGSFERSHWNAAAEDNDRARFFQRIFDDEPAANVEKQHRDDGDCEEHSNRENPEDAGAPSLRGLGFIQDCGREWVVGKHGKTGW